MNGRPFLSLLRPSPESPLSPPAHAHTHTRTHACTHVPHTYHRHLSFFLWFFVSISFLVLLPASHGLALFAGTTPTRSRPYHPRTPTSSLLSLSSSLSLSLWHLAPSWSPGHGGCGACCTLIVPTPVSLLLGKGGLEEAWRQGAGCGPRCRLGDVYTTHLHR